MDDGFRFGFSREPPDEGFADAERRALIAQSGLFDSAWVCGAYGVDAETALTEWCATGWRQGQQPNLYFDTNWYLGYYRDVASDGANPLVHYIQHGEHEGRRPSLLFDPVWYRETYGVPEGELCLAHYLRERLQGAVSPNPDFDTGFYLTNYPDIAAAGLDAFAHFMERGFREDRSPSAEFDTAFYRGRYLRNQPEVNPLLDYQRRRGETGIYPRRPLREATMPGEVARFSRPGEDFEAFTPLPAGAGLKAWLLAYYLPQFHRIPENDAWWGRGFTEWTNLGRGLPRFAGHYQPRTPRDLGHYSLADPETLRRQIAMAKAAGLHGFVFYLYWFNGHRLLETPLEQFLADASLDMPFCLMWTNENWTRRWDGFDDEVLISQDYRPSEDEDLIRTFGRHFADPRYIRLEGRPVLMIYRPGLIPDAPATIARWRGLFRSLCGEDPIMMMGQGFDANDPREFGLDGAIEFPPHKLTANLPKINDSLEWLDMEAKIHVVSYRDTVAVSLAEPPPPYPLIKTAVPSWDNDARREGCGLLLHGSTPAAFGAWLSALIDRACAAPVFGQPIVCINAWNEWAEGAYLEPDIHFGAAYLNALSRAVGVDAAAADRGKLLLVGHDAHRHGAQTLLLALGRQFRRAHGLTIEFMLLEGGPMVQDYAAVAPVVIVGKTSDLVPCSRKFAERGFRAAIVNTVAAGGACPVLAQAGIGSTLLVHELPSLVREKNLSQLVRRGLTAARQIVYAAAAVRDGITGLLGDQEDHRAKSRILPQGVYQAMRFDTGQRDRLRAELLLEPGTPLLIGVGYADLRKGFDLFLRLWRLLQDSGAAVHLAWAGNMDPGIASYMAPEIKAAEDSGRFHLLGFRRDVDAWLSAADVFLLTSREDPFPSSVLEAMSAGLPTVAFAGSGGIPEILEAHAAGRVVPRGDIAAMAEAAQFLCALPAHEIGERRLRLAAVAEHDFDFATYARRLADITAPGLLQVSAVIPNLNYAHHLPNRLDTVFRQWMPLREVILLDDASTDDSLGVANRIAEAARRDIRVIANARNSGSVFRQWRRAAEIATTEYLWIAEADDESEPRFLTRLLSALEATPDAVMAFSDSAAMDDDGHILSDSYKSYYNRAAPGLLSADATFAGQDFLRRCLAERNLILNVSSVLWRRAALLAALDRCEARLGQFRMAGDWLLYADILNQPGARLCYVAEPLNRHRRHETSVTHALGAERHVEEIAAVQRMVAKTLKADPQLRRRQAAYLEEVSGYLGAA
ncbi:MAG: glycosyltransferase [Proteobacteria bacterium]|nr:glycosyltransferase [Pseudomonadota bacterium]